jgi:hypothetical protein
MMVRACLLGATAGALGLASAHAESRETAKWGQVGGWQIRVDRSVGHGCFASQLYEDNTSLRVGFDIKKKTIYFMIGNPAWRSLEAGKVYAMKFVFDDHKSYTGELTGVMLGDRVFLDHSDVSYAFTKDFMERNGVRVYYRGAPITNLSLRNTYAAIGEVLNCQREISSAGGGSSQSGADPFARGSGEGRRSDPFSR